MYSAANDRAVLVERNDCKWQGTSFPGGKANLRVDIIEIDEKEKFMCRKLCIYQLSVAKETMFCSFGWMT